MSSFFAAIPVQTNLPPEYRNITAMATWDRSLVLGVSGSDNPRLYIFPVSINDLNEVQLGNPTVTGFKGMNIGGGTDFEISQIHSFYSSIIVLLKAKNAPYGQLMMMVRGETKITEIAKKVDIFTTDLYTNLNQKYIAISFGDQAQVLEYKNGSWSKAYHNKFKEPIISLSLCSPHLFIAFPSCLALYTINGKSDKPIATWSFKNSDNTFLMSISSTNFYTYTGFTSVLVDHQLASESTPQPLSNQEICHSINCNRIYASTNGDRVAIFDFKHPIQFTHLPQCRHIVGYQTIFFVSTQNSLYFLLNLSHAFEQVIAGISDNSLENIPSNFLSPLFSQMWTTNHRSKAFTLLSLPSFQSHFFDILNLYDFFIFPEDNLIQSMKTKSFDHLPHEKNLSQIKELINTLNQLRSTSLSIYVNTAIAEIFLSGDSFEEFLQFCNDKPKFHQESIDLFIDRNPPFKTGPCYAIYLNSVSRYNESAEAFKKFLSIPIIADQYVSLVIRNASNWEFASRQILFLVGEVSSHGDSFYLSLTGKILSDEAIPPSKTLMLVMDSHPEVYLMVLAAILEHKELLNRSSLAVEYTRKLADLLNATPAELARNWTGSPDRIVPSLIDALSRYEAELDAPVLRSILVTLSKVNVKNKLDLHVLLLRNLSEDTEALNAIWDAYKSKGNEVQIEECEKYCRKAKIPQSAFKNLAKLMKIKMDSGVTEAMMKIMVRNAVLIEVEDFTAEIDGEMPLEMVCDCLEETYLDIENLAQQKKMQEQIALSNLFESEYQLALAKAACIKLDQESTCAACGEPLGYSYVIRSAEGNLYHFKCDPSKSHTRPNGFDGL